MAVVTTPQDALVEALARFARRMGSYGNPVTFMETEDAAREFIERHRIVRLPEEADKWQAEVQHETYGVGWLHDPDEDCARRTATTFSESTGRIRPVYLIPGNPIEVNTGGEDG